MKKIFPLYALKLWAWPQTEFRPSYICGISSKSRFIPRAMPHAFPLQIPAVYCTIILACLTSKPLFFKQSFMVSIHLFCPQPIERMPAHTPIQTLLAIHSPFSPHGRTMGEHFHSFRPHSSLLHTTALSIHVPDLSKTQKIFKSQ